MAPVQTPWTRRFADPVTAAAHPLGDTEALPPVKIVGQQAILEIPIGALEAGSTLIPSFASLAAEPYRVSVALDGVALLENPSRAGDPALLAKSKPADPVQQQLDYFELTRRRANATLTLEISPASTLSAPCLLTLSVRPLHQPSQALPAPSAAALGSRMPALCQRDAPPAIAMRICSPTATAMALHYLGQPVDWLGFTHRCRDEATGFYGIWPLNIYQASRVDCLGAVEAFSDWPAVSRLLAADLPVIASIRYTAGALPGAPQRASAGHLVVVCGVDAQSVLVNDPAGEDRSQVTRSYPRAAFEAAWFAHRGAGYYFLPPAVYAAQDT